MKLLVTTNISSFRAVTDESAHVQYCDPGPSLSIQLTSPHTVHVWICNGREVTNELMDLWLGRACHVPKMMLVEDSTKISGLQAYAKGRVAEIAAFPSQLDSGLPEAESILRAAEMLYARTCAQPGLRKGHLVEIQGDKKTVLLVGAGIMNLITAELLVTSGFRVRIVDAGPDPRSYQDWTRLGATNGGGNARMFTYTEADNYNEKEGNIYQNMRHIFRKTAREGGWSVKSPKDFGSAENAWVESFEKIPPWLARAFREDIYSVNRESGKLWKNYIENKTSLFEDVEFRKDIIRMYAEPPALDGALKLHRELGKMVHDTSPEEFLKANPGFIPAAKSDHLAGGFTVDGFTLNIHPFVANLIDRISGLGGEFTWDCQVHSMHRNGSGKVTMLESQLGRLEADHFVVSAGVTGDSLLRGTASENRIHGVLGVWLQIPNVDNEIQHSIKIHRRGHLVEDINITVAKDEVTGEDVLMLGGGYGYSGLDRPPPDSPELMALFGELDEVARIYFPRGYAAAKKGNFQWPATGLGVFERISTAAGGSLIITGGNNTGGFAQAPAVAQAVKRALVGEHDPIHILFHPDRGSLSSDITYKSRLTESPILRNFEVSLPPLKVLFLCSDGPQHRYMRYRLQQTFPGYRCIVETSEGQTRHLMQKGRRADAAWMEYHGLRRYLFGYDRQRRAYFNRLVPEDYVPSEPDLTVDTLNCRKVWEAVEQWHPEITIVSGTKLIGKKLNERGGLMINLHIGRLPEYKGNHCIFFALYDGAVDEVGATLHRLTSHLDGGDVLDIVSPPILPSDNEDSLYTRCVHMAMDRVLEHAEQFERGQQLAFHPQKSAGRMFRHCDRTPTKEMWLWWNTAVNGLLRGFPLNIDW